MQYRMAVARSRGGYLDVRDFQPEDYVALWPELKACFAEADTLDPLRWAHAYADGGPAFTGWYREDILACAGVIIPWPGLATAWAVISAAGRRHPVMVHRTTRRFLDTVIKFKSLRRVEATALKQDLRAQRWLEMLGFQVESTRPQWGPGGQTGIQYVRLTCDA